MRALLHKKDAQKGLLAMSLLVFQGTSLSLTLRVSRTQEGPPYLASVAVIYTELIKLLLCVAAQLVSCKRAAADNQHSFMTEFMAQSEDVLSKSLPMLVPAGLFVMQQVCGPPRLHRAVWDVNRCSIA
jgi:uncharacterized membrane protein YciS (DUF1049 family)